MMRPIVSHNSRFPGLAVPLGNNQHWLKQGSAQSLIFDAPLLTSVTPRLAQDYTVTTPAAGTVRLVEDHEGILRRANVGEVRFKGARRVENLADHTSTQDYATGGTGTTIDNADGTVTLDCASGERRWINLDSRSWEVGKTYAVSWRMDDIVGPEHMQALFTILAGPTIDYDIANRSLVASSTDTGRYGFVFEVTAAGSAAYRIGIGSSSATTGACSAKFSDIQLEEISGAGVRAPSSYIEPEGDYDVATTVEVLGVKYFDTGNGNTLDSTTSFVYEATGDALIDKLVQSNYNVSSQTLYGATCSSTTVSDPFDGYGGYTLVEDSGTNEHVAYNSIREVPVSTDVTLTAYVKSSSSRLIMLAGYADVTDDTQRAFIIIDPSDGSEYDADADGNFTLTSSSIEDAGGGWYKVTAVVRNSALRSWHQAILICNSSGAVNYAGDGSSNITIFKPKATQDTDALLGYFAEPSRDNRMPFPLDLSEVGWVANGTTKGSTPITAPDGRLTAYSVIEDGSFGAHYVSDNGNTSTAAATHTASAYVKRGAGTRDAGVILAWSAGTIRASYSLDDMSVIEDHNTGAETGTAIFDDSGIESVGNGWFRIWVTGSEGVGGTDTSANFQLRHSDGTVLAGNYAGDSSSELYWWGMQVEEGENRSTIYPVTGARAVDDSLQFAKQFADDPQEELSFEAVLYQLDRTHIPGASEVWFRTNSTTSAGFAFYNNAGATTVGLLTFNGTNAANTGSLAGLADWSNFAHPLRYRFSHSVANGQFKNSAMVDGSIVVDPSANGCTVGVSTTNHMLVLQNIDQPASMKELKLWNAPKGFDWVEEI